MSRTSPYFIDLSEAERAVLEQRCRCYSAPHRVVVRANIVLLAPDGWANVDIALELGTMSMWSPSGANVIAKRVQRAWPTGAGRAAPYLPRRTSRPSKGHGL